MKTVILYFLAIVLFTSCNNRGSENSTVSSGDGLARVVPLNISEGFQTNQFSGDSVGELINSSGYKIVSGQTTEIKGTVIPLTLHHIEKAKATEKVSKLFSNTHSLASQPVKIIYHTETLKLNETSSWLPLINSTGDTVQTGVYHPVTEQKTICQLLPLANLERTEKKDGASLDIEFLDMEQGLSSSYVLAIDMDRQGNLWLGTLDGGVIRYDGQSSFRVGLENGLESDKIWAIKVDTHNNIWFGTEGSGVYKYDGDSLTCFTEKDGLGNNKILSLLEDSKGNIWFGTNDGGASCYNGSSIITYAKNEGLSNIIVSMLEDKNGNIWYSSFDEGVFKFDGKTFTQITTENGLAHNSVMPILEDREGHIWFGTWGGGISVFDGTQFSNFTTREGLINNNINSLSQDPDGNIWIGTWEGLSKFDGSNFTNFSTEDGLSNNDIRTILTDNFNNVWMGTWGGGLIKYHTSGFNNFGAEEGFSHSHVNSIVEDKQNNLWFGTWDGISKLEKSQILSYKQKSGLSGSFGSSLAVDSAGNIWIGTENGALNRFDRTYFEHFEDLILPNNQINKICVDRKGMIWLATSRTGLIKFDLNQFTRFAPENGFSDNAIHDIVEDREGNIWVATENAGLAKIADNRVTYYTEKEGLSSNKLNTLFEGSTGKLYIGTNDAGVCLFDGSEFTYYTVKEGMSSNTIRSITEDSENRIWIGTDKGLNLLMSVNSSQNDNDQALATQTEDQINISNFGIEDGLNALDFNLNGMFFDSRQRLWMGTGKNLSMIKLNVFKINKASQKAYVSQLTVSDKFIDFLHNRPKSKAWAYDSVVSFSNVPYHPVIPFSSNHLTFHFSATNFSSSKKVFYTYRIKELEDYWSVPSTETYADYRNIPLGPKTLLVKVFDPFNNQSEITSYPFRILPPWYLSLTAIIIFTLVLILVVLLVIRVRTATLTKRKNELLKMVAELEIAKHKAEESDRLKTAFLLNLSHEIRTPLNGILGFSNLLKEKGLSGEKQAQYIDLIHRGGYRMLNTINNLVEISRIETGQLTRNQTSFDLLQEVNILCQNFESEIQKKGLAFNYDDFKTDKKMVVSSDLEKLKGIFEQVIKNALKYTETGEIKVGLNQIDTANQKIEFYVKDSGIGIAKDRFQAIFEPFIQADIEDIDARQGAGVGLAIAKAYAAFLGGSISVNSKKEQGSTFTFSIIYQS